MKRILFSLLAILVAFVLITPAHAFPFLINRGTDSSGNRMIYDVDRDITWYDFRKPQDEWDVQVAWAEALSVNFGGVIFNNWRLPTAFNDVAPFGPVEGFNVTGSEMGHLYYTELDIDGGGSLNNPDNFQKFQNVTYWSGTQDPDNNLLAWNFGFGLGMQSGLNTKNGTFSAMAVLDGDVAAVPEPTTIALLGIGLASMVVYGVRRRRQRK